MTNVKCVSACSYFVIIVLKWIYVMCVFVKKQSKGCFWFYQRTNESGYWSSLSEVYNFVILLLLSNVEKILSLLVLWSFVAHLTFKNAIWISIAKHFIIAITFLLDLLSKFLNFVVQIIVKCVTVLLNNFQSTLRYCPFIPYPHVFTSLFHLLHLQVARFCLVTVLVRRTNNRHFTDHSVENLNVHVPHLSPIS